MSTPQYIDPEREDKNSASSWERVHYCPGSSQLIATLPPEARKQSNEAAESGTRIHAAWETGDESDLEMGEGEIKERLQALADEAYEKWRIDVLIPGLGADLANCQIKTERREERYWIFNDNLEKIASAKVDLAYVYPPFALIVDGKTGYKETTEAARNLQCKVQAVTLMEEFPSVTQVRVAVAAHRFKSLLTQADYMEDDLHRARLEILQDDWVSKQPDARRVPGSWCQYCAAKGYCKENAAMAMLPAVALASTYGAQMPALIKKQEIVERINQLPIYDVAQIHKKASQISAVLEACKARLKSLPADELASVGFQLTEGANQLEVINANGVVDTLIAAGLLKEEEVIGIFKLNNGAMEELVIPRIQAKTPGLNQLGAKNVLRGMLSEAGHIVYDKPENRKAPSLKEK